MCYLFRNTKVLKKADREKQTNLGVRKYFSPMREQ